MTEPAYRMPDDVKAEIEALADEALCGALLTGYSVPLRCERQAHGEGQAHWCGGIAWVGENSSAA